MSTTYTVAYIRKVVEITDCIDGNGNNKREMWVALNHVPGTADDPALDFVATPVWTPRQFVWDDFDSVSEFLRQEGQTNILEIIEAGFEMAKKQRIWHKVSIPNPARKTGLTAIQNLVNALLESA